MNIPHLEHLFNILWQGHIKPTDPFPDEPGGSGIQYLEPLELAHANQLCEELYLHGIPNPGSEEERAMVDHPYYQEFFHVISVVDDIGIPEPPQHERK